MAQSTFQRALAGVGQAMAQAGYIQEQDRLATRRQERLQDRRLRNEQTLQGARFAFEGTQAELNRAITQQQANTAEAKAKSGMAVDQSTAAANYALRDLRKAQASDAGLGFGVTDEEGVSTALADLGVDTEKLFENVTDIDQAEANSALDALTSGPRTADGKIRPQLIEIGGTTYHYHDGQFHPYKKPPTGATSKSDETESKGLVEGTKNAVSSAVKRAEKNKTPVSNIGSWLREWAENHAEGNTQPGTPGLQDETGGF